MQLVPIFVQLQDGRCSSGCGTKGVLAQKLGGRQKTRPDGSILPSRVLIEKELPQKPYPTWSQRPQNSPIFIFRIGKWSAFGKWPPQPSRPCRRRVAGWRPRPQGRHPLVGPLVPQEELKRRYPLELRSWRKQGAFWRGVIP